MGEDKYDRYTDRGWKNHTPMAELLDCLSVWFQGKVQGNLPSQVDLRVVNS